MESAGDQVSDLEYNTFIRQGKTWTRSIWYEDDAGTILDLSSGYTARMMIRADVDDASPVVTLTTENGRIALAAGDADTPNIVLTVSAADTAALTAWGTGVYDLELVSGATVLPVIEGFILLQKEPTR
jgi:hypothetical protein